MMKKTLSFLVLIFLFWERRECKNENVETRLLLKSGEGKNMRSDASKVVKGGENHILAMPLRGDENGLL